MHIKQMKYDDLEANIKAYKITIYSMTDCDVKYETPKLEINKEELSDIDRPKLNLISGVAKGLLKELNIKDSDYHIHYYFGE